MARQSKKVSQRRRAPSVGGPKTGSPKKTTTRKKSTSSGPKKPLTRKKATTRGRDEHPPLGRKKSTVRGRSESTSTGRDERTPVGRKKATTRGRDEHPPLGRKKSTVRGRSESTSSGPKKPLTRKKATTRGRDEHPPLGRKKSTARGRSESTSTGRDERASLGRKKSTVRGRSESTSTGRDERAPVGRKKSTTSVGPRKKVGRKKKKAAHRFPSDEQRKTAHQARKRPGRRRQIEVRSDDPRQRVQKVLAMAGFGSRRACEELITAGRVEIDRQIITELGTRVDPSTQQIRVDGNALTKPRLVHFAINKPKGVLCTNSDPMGRARAIDLVPERFGRLFTVGRLDQGSEGLILLTNDGELANRITHPRYGIEKVYQVQCAGIVTRDVLKRLSDGIYLAEGLVRVTGIKIKSHHKQSTILEMVLDEGKNREIRRMLAQQGHKVMRLIRIAVGPIRLAKLMEGEYRRLTNTELRELKEMTGMS